MILQMFKNFSAIVTDDSAKDGGKDLFTKMQCAIITNS